jgi:hypothetical protein
MVQVIGTVCLVQVDWYMFTAVYLTVIVWYWFHNSTYTSGCLDEIRTGGCSHLPVEVQVGARLKHFFMVENLEEEVVTLRSKIVNLNNNVEETETSTSIIENEEKHSRLLENKNEENRKSYAEVLKGRNHGQPESKKTIEDTSSRRPFMIKFNHDHD